MAIPEQHLVIMGAGGVGKTTLIVQFVQHRFIADYEPTIEDSYRKQVQLDGMPVTLDILDTAGQEEYAALKDQYMTTGEGFILAYSLVDGPTFEEVQQLRSQILKIKNNPRVPMVLVGNKLDLVSREPNRRAVSQSTAQQLADSWGVPFFESSAKDGTNVETLWNTLVRLTQKATGKPALSSGAPGSARMNTMKNSSGSNSARKEKSGGCTLL